MDENFVDLKREFFGIGLLRYKNAVTNSISFNFKKCQAETPCITVNCPFRSGRNNRFTCINADKFKVCFLISFFNL